MPFIFLHKWEQCHWWGRQIIFRWLSSRHFIIRVNHCGLCFLSYSLLDVWIKHEADEECTLKQTARAAARQPSVFITSQTMWKEVVFESTMSKGRKKYWRIPTCVEQNWAYRITEMQNGQGWKAPLEVIQSKWSVQAGSPRAHYLGLCPDSSWVPLEKETPQPLRQTCSSAQSASK